MEGKITQKIQRINLKHFMKLLQKHRIKIDLKPLTIEFFTTILRTVNADYAHNALYNTLPEEDIEEIIENKDNKVKTKFINYLSRNCFEFNKAEQEIIDKINNYFKNYVLDEENTKIIISDENNIYDFLYDLLITIIKSYLKSKYKFNKKNFQYEMTLYSGKQNELIQDIFPADKYYYINLHYRFEFKKSESTASVVVHSGEGFYSKAIFVVNNPQKVTDEIERIKRKYIFIEDFYWDEHDKVLMEKIKSIKLYNLINNIFMISIKINHISIEIQNIEFVEDYIIIHFPTKDLPIQTIKTFEINLLEPRYRSGKYTSYPVIIGYNTENYNLIIDYNKNEFSVTDKNDKGINNNISKITKAAKVQIDLKVTKHKISVKGNTREVKEDEIYITPIKNL